MNKKDIKKAQEKKDDRDGVRALKTVIHYLVDHPKFVDSTVWR